MSVHTLAVVSDLDGTLLDHETYSADAVKPALARLAGAGIPLILSSSKTRAEIEAVQRDLGVHGPFISENGGGVFLPAAARPAARWPVRRVGPYDLVAMGLPYAEVVARLHEAAQSSGVDIRGFSDMSDEDLAGDSGLSAEQARLAKVRDFGEPFRILGGTESDVHGFARACESLGLTLTRGGRYHHASGPHDKGAAVRILRDVLWPSGEAVRLVGFGDGLNDAELLAQVDVPVIVRGHDPAVTAELSRRLPGAAVTPLVGPAGVAAVIDAMVAPARRAIASDEARRGGEERKTASVNMGAKP